MLGTKPPMNSAIEATEDGRRDREDDGSADAAPFCGGDHRGTGGVVRRRWCLDRLGVGGGLLAVDPVDVAVDVG